MTASDDYVDTSSSDYTSYSADPAPPVADIDAAQYSVNNKITAVTIVVLFILVFFISSLQIYVKWRTWWRWSPQTSNGEAATAAAAAAAAAKARTGLDEATIALLPTFVYKQDKFTTLPHGAGDEEEGGSIVYNQLECAVCLSEFQENEKGRMLPSCKHSFHIECIDMWFYSHPTCPLCRTMVNKPADLSSASPPIMEEQAQGQVELGNAEASEDDMVSTRPASTNAADNGITTYPTGVLAPGDRTLALLNSNSSAITSSERPSPSSCTPYPLRYVPHITIEIPAGQDDGIHSPAGCLSLSSRRSCRCPSPFEQACSTSLKSPGLQVSLKRMLSSKGRRVSNQEGSVESPKETNNLPL